MHASSHLLQITALHFPLHGTKQLRWIQFSQLVDSYRLETVYAFNLIQLHFISQTLGLCYSMVANPMDDFFSLLFITSTRVQSIEKSSKNPNSSSSASSYILSACLAVPTSGGPKSALDRY